MSKTTVVISEEKLKAVSLPQATETYTVISHEFIVNHVRDGLTQRGFTLLSSEFRANHNGEVARGVHVVQYGDDPDMKMIFSWVNSYDKSTKFQCGVGAQVNANESYILAEGMTNWIRKHTGSADTEAEQIINDQLDKAEEHFKALVASKDLMKEIIVSPVKYYELLGRLYFTNALSTQQLSAVKHEYNNSRVTYAAPAESLWVMYNHVLVVLKSSHPKTWMKQQTHIHYVFMNEFDILNHQVQEEEVLEEVEVIDPLTENYGQPENQTNLLVQIAEVTGDDSVLLTSQDQVNETHEFSMAQLAGVKAPENIIDALMDAPEIDASEIDMSKVTWIDAPDIVQYTDPAGNTFEAPVVDKTFTETLDDAMIAKAQEDTEILEEMVWGGSAPEIEELLEEVTELETAPERVKFAVDLTEEDLTPVEEEELLEEEKIIGEQPFITDEEEDLIMDQVLTPIEAARESFDWEKPEPVAPCAGHDAETEKEETTIDLPDLEGEYSLDEIPEVLETIQERIDEVQELETEEYLEVEQEDEELPEVPVDTELELEFSFNPTTEEPVEEELLTEAQPEESVEEDHEEDFHVKNVLANEIEELFGEEKDFTYKLSEEKYVITFEADNSTLELDKEYIDLLL